MALAVDIFGSLVQIPDKPEFIEIENWGTGNILDQEWKRKELPDFFTTVEYDKNGNLLLTEEQNAYAVKEKERCRKGFYFLNRGVVTYISGKHYFYLQWWKLEDDIYPDYRDTDRRYFLFLNHWENILWCLGVIRGKKRREGASSQAVSNLMYECIFFRNTNCGLISKSQIDSRDTFTDMLGFGYRLLPVFFKPKQLNREDSVTEFVFAHKSESSKAATGKVSVIKEEASYRSKVNFRAPVLNAYDRGRLSRILLDEFGKLEADIPASQLFAIVKKTLVKGVKRVGFAEMPSTVNSWKKGGMEFKKIWDGANQFQKIGNVTVNRLVKYLSPAYDGYEGFIDRYGMSVIDAPTQEQYEYLVNKWVVRDPYTDEVISELTEEDIKLGAKEYVLVKRRAGLSGTDLEEEIRQNPCNEDEMFMAANVDCVFNATNINNRRKVISSDTPKYRYGLFQRNVDKNIVEFKDVDENKDSFHWKLTAFPERGQANKYTTDGRLRTPARIRHGAITVDGYSNSQGGRKYGSKASAWIGIRPNSLDPQNTGKAIGHLYGRPAIKEKLHEQTMLAAEYYGYKVWYEHNSDDYLSYYRERGKVNYLGTYPISTIDPTKRDEAERYKGFPTTPFSLTKQLDCGITYFEYHCDLVDFDEVLENALIFDPYKRTEYDAVVSFLMLLVILSEPNYEPKPTKDPLIEIFENKNHVATRSGGLPINLESLVNVNF